MYYVIFAQDIPGTLEKRLAVREQHLARLKQLQAEGRLLTAGPNPAIDDENPGEAGFTGSTVIAQFKSPVCRKKTGLHKILMLKVGRLR